MSNTEKTYIVYPIRDDAKPFILHDKNKHINLVEFEAFLRGERPMSEYKPLDIKVKHKDALKYDFYHFSSSMGLLSQKAIAVLSEKMLESYEKIPVFVNKQPYFALKLSKTTDCLDFEKSVYVDPEGTKENLLSIATAVFHFDKLDQEQWFSIPQYPIYIYCTARVAEKIKQTDLVGFEFIFTSVLLRQ
jgi:hypothetical protein